jgi:predicted secreted protein
MNQTKLLLISMTILSVLIGSACARQPGQQPLPVPSTASDATPPVLSQPTVSTSLPSESTPLSTAQAATDTPAVPSTDGQTTVTLDDRGKTISLAVGENFLLNLGETYTWDISISDESVISRVKNITVIRGAQGVYQALKPGTATLTATGDPLCRQSKPACAMPSILFEVTVEVK